MSSEIRWDDSQSLLTTLLAGTPRKASTEEDNRHVQEDIKALTQLDELLALVLTLDQGESQFLNLTSMIWLSFYNRTLGEGKYASVQCQRFMISQLPTELPSLPRLMGHEFVAVKRCKDARGVEEILGELRARVPRALRNHPNIVGLLGYGWDAADDAFFAPFLAMEYATYGSLEYALNSFSFSIDEKRNLCVDVALGLEAIHGSDFIHGDIKPQNVLLYRHEVRTWTAKLTDFGMSASTLSDTKSEFHYFGTRVYNAPELGLSQRDTLLTLEAAQKCDIYSYGLVVCVLIKGGYEQARHIFETPPTERLRAALLSFQSDGIPERYLVPITIVLWSTLPHEPAHRGTMEGIRENWLGVPRAVQMRPKAKIKERILANAPLYMVMDVRIPPPIQQRLIRAFEALVETRRPQTSNSSASQIALANACYQLAVCFSQGIGTKPDLRSATKYLDLAACYGHEPAMYTITRIRSVYKSLFPEETDLFESPIEAEIEALDTELEAVPALKYAAARFRKIRLLTSRKQFAHLKDPRVPQKWTSERVTDVLKARIQNSEVDPKGIDKDGFNALYYACCWGNAEMVEFLVREGVKAVGGVGFELLPLFPDSDIHRVGKLLLEAGADLDHKGVVKLPELLEHFDASVPCAPLYTAVSARNVLAVKTLLELGAKPQPDVGFYDGDNFVASPLVMATKYHLHEIVDLLLTWNARMESDGVVPKRALSYVCSEDTPFFRRLLYHGKDYRSAVCLTLESYLRHGYIINQKSGHWGASQIPIHLAAQSAHWDPYVFRAFVDCGADPMTKDGNGLTAIHWVLIGMARGTSSDDRNAALKYLLEECKIDPNSEANDGDTPLMMAVQLNLYDAASMLLRHGADPHKQKGPPGFMFALHIAATFNRREFAELLVEFGADIESEAYVQGITCTPLSIAVVCGSKETADFLIARGTKPVLPDGRNLLQQYFEYPDQGGITHLLTTHPDKFAAPAYLKGNSEFIAPLFFAILGGQEKGVEKLLQLGVDPHIEFCFRGPLLVQKVTPHLRAAALNGPKELVEYQRKHGSPLFEAGLYRCIPFHLARLLIHHPPPDVLLAGFLEEEAYRGCMRRILRLIASRLKSLPWELCSELYRDETYGFLLPNAESLDSKSFAETEPEAKAKSSTADADESIANHATISDNHHNTLPDTWEIRRNLDGTVFYMDKVSKKVAWVPTKDIIVGLPQGWETFWDDNGGVYYYNSEKDEEQWDDPYEDEMLRLVAESSGLPWVSYDSFCAESKEWGGRILGDELVP